MHWDFLFKRHASSIAKMDLVKPEETTIIEPAMSQQPWIRFAGRTDYLS